MIALLLLSFAGTSHAEPPVDAVRSEAVLVESLSKRGDWSSVHAAEYLLFLGKEQAVLDAFRSQYNNSNPPFRIGVWRVLAQAEPIKHHKSAAIENIRNALLNEEAPDRLHALESLAKLHVPMTSDAERQLIKEFARDASAAEFSFANWRLFQNTPTPEILTQLTKGLSSDDKIQRLRVAFVLGEINMLPSKVRSAIHSHFEAESKTSPAYPYLAIACGTDETKHLLNSAEPTHKALAIQTLAKRGIAVDCDTCTSDSEQSPIALRQAIAFALLVQQQDTHER